MIRAALRRSTAWVAAHPIAAFTIFFAVFPFLVPYQSLATQVLIFGLFALGFNLLYGYTGLLSFGHAAYYGLGAYGTGIALAKLKVGSLWVALGIGLGTAVVGGVVVGFFCLRRRGIYFAMLTLAFSQMLYFIAFHAADLTGGDDGLRGIPLHSISLPGMTVSLRNPLAFYFFAYVLVVLAVAGLKRILDSPFGAVLQAIRENSDRAVACGYDINRIKLLSFVFSALFAGLAGGLDALRLTVVPVDALYWTTSGQVVIMTLLGGAGTFFGPFVGAATFLILADRLSLFIEAWPLVIGVIFMAFVLFLPKGIWGTLLTRILPLLLGVFVMSTSAHAQDRTTVTLGTATPGGGFPVFGQAFADAIQATDPSLEIQQRNTKGSTENVPLLERGELDLALVQGEVAYEALSGVGRPPANLRILTAMYSSPGMFVVRGDSPSRTIADLKGKPVAFGARGSGLVILARYVLDGIGLDQQKDFEAIFLDAAGDGPKMVMDGRAAALWGGGIGWPGFTAVAQAGGRFIAPTAAEIERIRAKHAFLKPQTIPADSYPGQGAAIDSVGSWSFVMTRATLPDEVAYRLARALDRGAAEITRRLPAARETTAANTVAAVPRADLIHPGVVRYLKGIGLLR